MIKFNRIIDEVVFHILISDIYKYLELCSTKKLERKYSPTTKYELLKFSKYDTVVSNFIDKFKESFTEEQTEEMFYRLKRLNISEITYKQGLYLYCLSLGYYDSNTNEIVIEYYRDRRISKESVNSTLIHELIHMASTRELEDGVVTGFEIPYYLGKSLNEGYTEYITEKYFTKGIEYVKSNSMNLFFAKGIENIIGAEKMQDLFFNANLNGLINELSKYATKEEIIKILFLMDRQDRVMRSNKDLYTILEAIATLNARKLREDLRTGKIDYETYQIEYAKKVSEYLKGNMWSEATKIIKDEDSFILKDQGFSSELYELRRKEKNKEKYYQ